MMSQVPSGIFRRVSATPSAIVNVVSLDFKNRLRFGTLLHALAVRRPSISLPGKCSGLKHVPFKDEITLKVKHKHTSKIVFLYVLSPRSYPFNSRRRHCCHTKENIKKDSKHSQSHTHIGEGGLMRDPLDWFCWFFALLPAINCPSAR